MHIYDAVYNIHQHMHIYDAVIIFISICIYTVKGS